MLCSHYEQATPGLTGRRGNGRTSQILGQREHVTGWGVVGEKRSGRRVSEVGCARFPVKPSEKGHSDAPVGEPDPPPAVDIDQMLR